MIVVREMCLSRLRIQLPIDHHWLSREEAFGRENILSSWIRQSLCLFCTGEFGKEKKKAKNGPHVRVEHLPFVAVNWWEKRSSFSLEGKEQNVPQAQLASSHSKTFKSYLSRSVIWGFEENFLSDQNSAFRKLGKGWTFSLGQDYHYLQIRSLQLMLLEPYFPNDNIAH